MKKFLATFFKLAILTMLVVGLWKYELVLYGFAQLKGQLTIILNAREIEEVIHDPALEPEQREKLLLTERIRRFAMDSLGLHNSKNYTTYYDQNDKPVMWVVTGCLPYELKAKEWWFPFLGSVSYKGFFVEPKALEEAYRVQLQGYETDIYSPSAWSTLGYFRDPILSGMLKRGPGRLAELIIHELTHATIYLKSSVDFNENLATFIGEKGALLFLQAAFGNESEELKRYAGYLHDEEIYSDYMMRSARQLDSLYSTFSDEMPVKEKALLKYRMIARIMSGIRHLPLAFPERYAFNFSASRLPNNTEFMSFLRYRKKQQDFDRILEEKFQGNLKKLIEGVVRDESVLH